MTEQDTPSAEAVVDPVSADAADSRTPIQTAAQQSLDDRWLPLLKLISGADLLAENQMRTEAGKVLASTRCALCKFMGELPCCECALGNIIVECPISSSPYKIVEDWAWYERGTHKDALNATRQIVNALRKIAGITE